MQTLLRVCCSCIEQGKVLEEATYGCKDDKREYTCDISCTTKENCEQISVHTPQTSGLCDKCLSTRLRLLRKRR